MPDPEQLLGPGIVVGWVRSNSDQDWVMFKTQLPVAPS